MMIDAAIQRIRAYRDHRGWTNNRLATEAKVPESCVRDLDDAGWSPTLRTLRKLEAVVPEQFTGPSRRRRPTPSHEARA